MAYLNKIDINGRTYYLQHLTDGKYEAVLPAMTKDSNIIIQDASTSGNVGDADKPVYIKNNKIVACNKDIGNEVTPVYMDYGKIKPLSEDVGSTVNPIYMKAGAITASTETVGSDIVPIYMQDGVITPFDSTVGSDVKPMYLNNGTITESDATVGSGIVPVYMSSGTITASTETVGSNIKPIYMDNGEIAASDATVGSGIKPIYMQDGTITTSNETVGTNIKLIYMYEGTITESNANVGSGIIPTYMNNGEITASTTTVGAINQPIYMSNGEITVCSDSIGGAGIPVYMKKGVITACGTIPISSGGTDATTAEEALANFGLTATAAELNTLDGITATVTELNYVDGVTSNIQAQFNNQDERLKTMEAFFKEADIDASQEFIDTLKEIQAYIESDKTGAASMEKSIGNNAAAITKLNGDSTTEGSVAKAVADAKTALNNEIDKKVDKAEGMSLFSDAERTKLEGIETNANKYVHPSHTGCTSGLYKITVDEFGHVSSVVAVTKEDIVDLGIPSQDTTYDDTIASLQEQIDALKALVESYHPVVEPEPEPEPDETE